MFPTVLPFKGRFDKFVLELKIEISFSEQHKKCIPEVVRSEHMGPEVRGRQEERLEA